MEKIDKIFQEVIISHEIVQWVQEMLQYEHFLLQYYDVCFFRAHFWIDLGSWQQEHDVLFFFENEELFVHQLLSYEREIREHGDVFSFWVYRA